VLAVLKLTTERQDTTFTGHNVYMSSDGSKRADSGVSQNSYKEAFGTDHKVGLSPSLASNNDRRRMGGGPFGGNK
jgi:hypothetical protein